MPRPDETGVPQDGTCPVQEQASPTFSHVNAIPVDERTRGRGRAPDTDFVGGFRPVAAGIPIDEQVIGPIVLVQIRRLDPAFPATLKRIPFIINGRPIGKMMEVRTIYAPLLFVDSPSCRRVRFRDPDMPAALGQIVPAVIVNKNRRVDVRRLRLGIALRIVGNGNRGPRVHPLQIGWTSTGCEHADSLHGAVVKPR